MSENDINSKHPSYSEDEALGQHLGEGLVGVDPETLNGEHWRHELNTTFKFWKPGWLMHLRGLPEHLDGEVQIEDDTEKPGHKKVVLAAATVAFLGYAGYKFFQHRSDSKLGGHFVLINPEQLKKD
jgi:hypothetical protein